MAARLRLRVYDDGAIRVFRKERRGFDLRFGNHVHVRSNGRAASGVHIADNCTIANDLRQVEPVAVDRERAAVLGEAGGLAAVRVAFEVAGVGCAGYKSKQLDGASTFNIEVLNLLARKCVGAFAGRGRRNRGRLGRDGDSRADRRDLHADAGNSLVVAYPQDDALADQIGEALHVEARVVGRGREVREREKSAAVALCRPRRPRRGVGEGDSRAGDGRTGAVLHRARERSGANLRVGAPCDDHA